MTMSTKAGQAALVLLLCGVASLARGQDGDRIVIPNLPPCIDLVLIGHLQSVGDPEPMNIPDDLLGHSIYRYRLDVDRTIYGAFRRQRVQLYQAGHALMRVDRRNAVVFLRRTDRGGFYFADSAVAVPDRRGELFIPLLGPPDPEDRSGTWLPDGFERFARPVQYRDRDLRQAGYRQEWLDYALQDDADGYLERRGRRTVVLKGIVVDDIPAVLALQHGGRCWR